MSPSRRQRRFVTGNSRDFAYIDELGMLEFGEAIHMPSAERSGGVDSDAKRARVAPTTGPMTPGGKS